MITCFNRYFKIPWLLGGLGIALLLLFSAFNDLYAQGIVVRGIVSDSETKESLPGVNVVIEGTTTGVTTNIDGAYQITVPTANAALVFSFIGYLNERIEVSGRNQIDVILKPDIKSLDEVVVIGYGSARRIDLSGAVSTLAMSELQDLPVMSVGEMLTGRVPGVQISSVDGAPDADIIIKIRGGGSITQDNTPLLVVDGFPVDDLRDISPNDIESIVVLKDASSTAIYGSRGAYGVILLTTKGARSGATKVSYNGYVQQSRFPLDRKMDVLNPYEFALMQYEYAKLSSAMDLENFTMFFGVYDDLELYKYQKGTDWQDKMFGMPQYSHSHNVSMTGGSNATRLFLSANHNDTKGIMISSGQQRTNLNFKMNHDLSKRLRLELNPRFSSSLTGGAGTSGSADLRISDIITARPIEGLVENINFDITDSDEEYETYVRSLVRPDEKVKDDYRKRLNQRFDLNAAINWQLMDRLTFRSEFGIRTTSDESERYYGPKTGRSRQTGAEMPMGTVNSSSASSMRLANILTYNIFKSEHNISIMLGQELVDSKRKNHVMEARRFPIGIEPERMFANMALGETFINRTFIAPNDRLSSFFGRAHYILSDKYIFNVTIRADGSTKFAPGRQWGYFPAASAAWRISNESFMQNLTFINELKLRAGYGLAGNNRIADDQWRPVFTITDNRMPGFGNTTENHPYYAHNGLLYNSLLQWESKITRNIAVEFSMFNNSLIGTLEAFNNSSKDLLLQVPLPDLTSYSGQVRNIGSTTIKGIELSLNHTIVRTRDFSLSASFNIGIDDFVIDKFADEFSEIQVMSNWHGDVKGKDDYRIAVGKQIGLIYGWVTNGFYSVDDFESFDPVSNRYILKAGVPGSEITNVKPGSLKLLDLNGDGIVDLDDRKIIGNTNAKHSGGFGLTTMFKGFDLNTFFTWKYGFDVYNTNSIQYNTPGRTKYGNLLDRMNSQNRFTYIDSSGDVVRDIDGLRAINQHATVWSPFSTGSAVLVTHSDAIEDGSYLRLSQLTLGYELPKSLSKKFLVDYCRLYLTVYNVWLWTKYTGFDPEVNTNRGSDRFDLFTPGLDVSAYPRSRSFALGVNVNF